MQLPSALSIGDLERIDMLTGKRPDAAIETELAGKRVAGEQEVTGRVRVITDINQIESFERGEILVARMTDPTWYPLFSQARGIITEVGGWLSHAAIVAREYDLPAIVGVSGICQSLQTGDVVTLKLDGAIELVENRREEKSAMRSESFAKVNNSIGLHPAIATDSAIATIYHLTAARLSQFQLHQQRRAQKNRLSDRRSSLRIDGSGDVQDDRRALNRAANRAAMLKKAS
jgi:phosphohistidine swiveling domain-containing protein